MIRINQLGFNYGNNVVLKDITLNLEEGRIYGLLGENGVGKTTLIIQHIINNLNADECLYVNADDFYFSSNKIVDLANNFSNIGGKYLFIDEIHKHDEWARELKLIYDYHPDLHVVFSGSSILDITKGANADLSRRAVIYKMQGLSFREYLKLFHNIDSRVFSLAEVLENKVELDKGVRPLQYFKQYLKNGYYPFALNDDYKSRLQAVVNQTLESDIPQYANMHASTSRKLRQLLAIISQNVPFKPNMKTIGESLGVSRNNVAMNDHTTQAGGTCALVSKGYFKAKDCKFMDNSATSRGGAVRGLNDNAIMFFDRCSFTGNRLTDSGNVFGSCIQLTGGCVLMNNCTMAGNTGKGAELNGGGAFLILNTTIINWAEDTYGGFRCESKAKSNTMFMNNAFLSEKAQTGSTGGFVYQGTGHDITSAGYNIMAAYSGTDIKKPTDIVYGPLTEGTVNDEGCYIWDQTSISTVTTFAKVSDVIAVARSFSPTYNSDVTNVGPAFAAWVGDDGFAVDQLGNPRNPEKMQRGSYDAGLN